MTAYAKHVWTDPTLISSAKLNEMEQAIWEAHSGVPTAHVYLTAAVTIPDGSGTWTSVTFDTELFDNFGMHDNLTNNTRLVCQEQGVYLITANVGWNASSVGYRAARIMRNGVTVWATNHALPHSGAAAFGQPTLVAMRSMAVGEYVELQLQQTSGVALGLQTGAPNTVLTAALLRRT